MYVRRTVQCTVEKRQIGSGCRLAPYVRPVQGSGRWWGLGIGQREGVYLGANLGRAIVSNGDFTAYVCDSASTVGAAVWRGACGGPRHCCIRWGTRRPRKRGGFFFGGGFVLHFHNGKCHCLADGEMFPIRMQKLYNVSVRQTYR